MAAGDTYVPIATTTLGSTQSSVTFSSIASTYTDLILVINGKTSAASAAIYVQFNDDTTTSYSGTHLSGLGGLSSGYSERYSNNDSISFLWTNGSFTNQGTYIAQIQNYSNSTTYKTLLHRNNSVDSEVTAGVGLWRKTDAITKIKIYTSSNYYNAGTTFSLYGIAAA